MKDGTRRPCDPELDVLVIGGGISGLTAAWLLKRQGLRVRLLEGASVAGGNIRTVEQGGFRMETGPHSFLGSSEYVWRLIEELGAANATEPASAIASNRYIYRDGALHPLPMGVGSFLSTRLLSLKGKLRLMVEPLIRNRASEKETAWEFFDRRFGEEAATYIMGPFVSGIYAGDVRQLGARAAFQKFWSFERDRGSMVIGAFGYMWQKKKRLAAEGREVRRGLYSIRGGLGGLTGKLADELGAALTTDARVDRVFSCDGGLVAAASDREWSARAMVLAVPPRQAADLLRELAPGAGDRLRTVPMAPVTLTHWTFTGSGGVVPPGFGLLVPRLYDVRALGTLFPSQLFTGRAPGEQPLLSSFYGGSLDPEALEMDDDELESTLHRDHQALLGPDIPAPRTLRTFRYDGAIPQLLPDHPEGMSRVQEETDRVAGLFLAGNYLTGVGMEQAVESGYAAASRVADHLHLMPEKVSA